MPQLATDPPVSEAQRRAMFAAREGRSTLGIPRKVGEEFVGKDASPLRAMLRGFLQWAMQEAEEPEHSEDELSTAPNAGVPLGKRKGKDCANDSFALDRSSARTVDADGHMHVAGCNISKAIVNPYMGKEIPGADALGLDPNKLYQLLRDPKELEKAAHTFDGKPLMIIHRAQTADDHDYEKVVGAVSNPVWDAPYLKADLVVWPGEAIDSIKDGSLAELSCGYRYVPVMEPGSYNGVHFDGRMTQLSGNHISLVAEGRAGADVMVADGANEMQWVMLERAISALAA